MKPGEPRQLSGGDTLRTLDPKVRPIAQLFVRFLTAQGLKVEVKSTRRDPKVQAKLYADYIAGRSRYPAAPPGKSQHGIGRAFDLKLTPPMYAAAGACWEAAGFTWGGRFSDEIHFDFRPRS